MKMLIAGEWMDAADGRTIEIDNPATHEFIDTAPRAGAEDVDRAVSAAREGYRINRRLPAHRRWEYLRRAAQLVLENNERLRDSMIAENGKSHFWADFEIRKTAEILLTVAERTKDPHGATYPMDAMKGCEGQMSMLYRQSIGVVGGIIPFNFPAEMLAYKVAGALAGGTRLSSSSLRTVH